MTLPHNFAAKRGDEFPAQLRLAGNILQRSPYQDLHGPNSSLLLSSPILTSAKILVK
jgi:hypothetical protein